MPSATTTTMAESNHLSPDTQSQSPSPPSESPISLSNLTKLQIDLESQVAEISAEISALAIILSSAISSLLASSPSPPSSTDSLSPTAITTASSRGGKSPHQQILDVEITIQSAHLTLQRLSGATKTLRKTLGREVVHHSVPLSSSFTIYSPSQSQSRFQSQAQARNPYTAIWGPSLFLKPSTVATATKHKTPKEQEDEKIAEGLRHPSPLPCEGHKRRRLQNSGLESNHNKNLNVDADVDVDEVLDCRLFILKKRRVADDGDAAVGSGV